MTNSPYRPNINNAYEVYPDGSIVGGCGITGSDGRIFTFYPNKSGGFALRASSTGGNFAYYMDDGGIVVDRGVVDDSYGRSSPGTDPWKEEYSAYLVSIDGELGYSTFGTDVSYGRAYTNTLRIQLDMIADYFV